MRRNRFFPYFILLLLCFQIKATAQRIIIPDPTFRPPVAGLFELVLKEMKVEADIQDQIARVSLDQVFHNPTKHQLQGYFLFPISEGSSIRDFSMFINGVETKGELLDAKKARSIYEEILRKFQDPALLEYQKKDLLKVSVFPIQPGSDQRIKLTYTQVLPKDNGTTNFVLPIPASTNQLGPQSFSLKAALKTSQSLKTIYCPSHVAEIRRKGQDEATIGLEFDQSVSPTDFQLYFTHDQSDIGASMLAYKEGKEDGFFFLNLSPGLNEKTEVISKDITFVLDASGSMAGPKMEQAKKALLFCLENLNKGDRFNIIRFSTEAEAAFAELQENTADNRRKAREYVEELQAIGGTNVEEALDLAFNQDQGNRLHLLIFLTDGKPTIGETDETKLLDWVKKENTNDRRIFTFGIGTELNTHLLDQLTQLTRAYRTYVLPEEDIELKVSNFFTKVSAPVLTNLEWKIVGSDGVEWTQVYPKELPDLFKGGSLSLIGRYKGKGTATLVLSGLKGDKKTAYEYEFSFPEKRESHDFIPPLWGARSVGYLLDQIRLNGESEELVTEVVRLAKRYGIITPYTSYLIIEDEVDLIGSNQMRREDALMSPRMSGGAPTMADQMEMYDESIEEKKGKESVRASEEIQQLNRTENMAQYQTGREWMEYESDDGQVRNLAENIVNVQGRAIYQNNGIWTDSRIQETPEKLNLNRIEFNSEAYFQLMQDEPASQEFLALGRNVRFVLNGEVYEVYN